MSENNQKNKKNLKKILKRFIVPTISASAILGILLIVALAFRHIQKLENSYGEISKKLGAAKATIEISELLTIGLSIIAIAIAVWAALNIINAVNRSDLEQQNEKLSKANETLDTLKKQSKNIQEELQKNIIIQKELFIKELTSFSPKDPVIKPIITSLNNEIQENSHNVTIPFDKLITVELLSEQVYNLHNSAGDNANILIYNAKRGIEIIQELIKSNLPEIIKLYLSYRKYDFYFFMGYCETDKITRAQNFLYAAKGYKEISSALKIYINEETINEFYKSDETDNLQLATYLANAIGEAYSKITQYYNSDKTELDKIEEINKHIKFFSEEAVRYCNIASEFSEDKINKSMYYRNLGCALERKEILDEKINNKCKFSNYKETISAFQKAVWSIFGNFTSSQETIKNAYFTLLSYYKKYIWYQQNWPNDKKNITNEEFNSLDTNKIKDFIDDICTMYYVAKTATIDCKHSAMMPVFYGISCCLIVIAIDNNIQLSNNIINKTRDFFLSEIETAIDILTLIVKENTKEIYMLDTFDYVSIHFNIIKQLYNYLQNKR